MERDTFAPRDSPEKYQPDNVDLGEVDLRRENEIFRDHERLKAAEDEAFLKLARDQLVEEVDGVMHIALEAYGYDFATNPFLTSGPRGRKVYAIARYLDVTFLHHYMYQNILVCGLRSREFAGESSRAKFIKHLRESGGDAVRHEESYDFLALKFSPYVEYHSTLPIFQFYHEQSPHTEERPQYPLDAWVIYDAEAYEKTGEPRGHDPRTAYRLKSGYVRSQTVLGVAQIN